MAKKVQGFGSSSRFRRAKPRRPRPWTPRLGPHGVSIMDFCKAFDARTAKDDGLNHPGRGDHLFGSVLHVHHQDAADCGAAEAGGEHGEGIGRAQQNKVGTVTAKQVEEIAKPKMPDLNCALNRVGGGPWPTRRDRWDSTSSSKATMATHGRRYTAAKQQVEDRPTRWTRRCRCSRRSSSPSSTRPSGSRSGSASIPSTPTRWCAARSSCRTGSASRSGCW